MVTYSIYKIVCRDAAACSQSCYVGHTTDLAARWKGHHIACEYPFNNSHNLLVYRTIRKHGGITNWEMVAVEELPGGSTRTDALVRERYWMEQLSATLNSVRAHRTHEDKQEDKKASYHRCKEKLFKKLSTPVTCECGVVLRRDKLRNHLKTARHSRAMMAK
jgi:hypothetical protein